MLDTRLADLRQRALALTEPDKVAELERMGLLWWFVASSEPDPNKRPAIRPDEIEAGWYKVSSGVHAPLLPAAIFKDAASGDLCASRGFRPVEPYDIAEVRKAWVWIAKKPIPYEDYTAALEAGAFPADITIGSNNPPEGIDALKDAIAQQSAEADAWLKRYEQNGLDEAAAKEAGPKWENLLKLFTAAEKERETEASEPWKAYKSINEKWGFAKKAEAVAKRLKAAITAYAAKERARREAAVRAEVAKGTPVDKIVPAVPVRIEGATRAVPLPRGAAKKVCLVTDYAKALDFLKDRPEIKAAVEKLVQQLYEAGIDDVPGTKIDKAAA